MSADQAAVGELAAVEDAAGNPTVTEAPDCGGADDTPALSKRQIKRKAKLEKLQEKYKKQKVEQKEHKRLAQEERLRAKQAELEKLTPEEQEARRAAAAAQWAQRKQEKEAAIKRLQVAQETGPKIIVDLDFWDYMTDKEHKSLISQLGFAVGANKRAACPCSIHFAGLCPAARQQLTQQFPGHNNWHATIHEATVGEAFRAMRDNLVYLSADSSTQLQSLEPGHGYIIGGIVDRNRHKGLCKEKAEGLNISTACLPIANNVELKGSKVLTVNQMVQILLAFLEHSCWSKALASAVPARKEKQNDERPPDTRPGVGPARPAQEDVDCEQERQE